MTGLAVTNPNPTLLLAPLNGALTAQDRNGATTFVMTSGDASYYPGFGQGGFGEGGFGGVPIVALQLAPTESASIATTDHILPQSGAMRFALIRVFDSGAEEILGSAGTVGAGSDMCRWGITATDQLFAEWSSDGGSWRRIVSVASIALDTWYTVSIGWDGTNVRLTLDNAYPVLGTRDTPVGAFGAGPILLSAPAGAQYAIGDYAVYDQPLPTASVMATATPTGLDAPLYRGDDRQVTIAITDADGDAVPLYGCSVWFTVKSAGDTRSDDADALAQCVAVIGNDGTITGSGIAAGDISAGTLTATFAVPLGACKYDVQVKDVNGVIRTIASGAFTGRGDVTRDTSAS